LAELSKDPLDVWLTRIIRERLAGTESLQSLHRSRFPHIGSYDCDRVTATFSDGREIVLFLKDFARSRQSKDFVERRRVRELEVYRQLLDSRALGTPAFYGSEWSEEQGRFWMLLELVRGETVDQIDERNGAPAVEWLAQFQAHFLERADKLRRADFLIEHDWSYFQSKADAARRDVAQISPEALNRLDDILAVYEPTVRKTVDGPKFLVHGGFIPWHIFVDRSAAPPRVAVVDWELAARGSLLYDLAIFVDDAEPSLRSILIEKYRERARQHGLPLPDQATMTEMIECFRIHRVIDWLSRSVEKSFSGKKVASLLKRAEAGCRQLRAARQSAV